MMTWLYDIPVFSMTRFYVETKMIIEMQPNAEQQRSPEQLILRDVFIVHRVKNMLTGKK